MPKTTKPKSRKPPAAVVPEAITVVGLRREVTKERWDNPPRYRVVIRDLNGKDVSCTAIGNDRDKLVLVADGWLTTPIKEA